MLVLFDRLPLGARFRYVDDRRVWVKLGRGSDQRGTIAAFDEPVLDWPGQAILALCDTPEERAACTVEWLDVLAPDVQAAANGYAEDLREARASRSWHCPQCHCHNAREIAACLRCGLRRDALERLTLALQAATVPGIDGRAADLLLAVIRDAERYRYLRAGNAYEPEEQHVTGGEQLDRLCDTRGEAPPYY